MLLLTVSVFTHGKDLVKDFYKKKNKTITKEAYDRAEGRLAKARIGMSQIDFFDLMQMEVLGFNKKVKDVLVEGYLFNSSQSTKKEPGTRNLIFGYVENGREVQKILVVFKHNRVHKIEKINPIQLAKQPK